MRYIVVGNSLYKTFSKMYKYQEGDYFIGLDEGSLEIIKNNYTLNEAWGDFDSGNNIEFIKSKANKFKKYPKEKNETDLELILMNLDVTCEILIYDITGARLDHELVNILMLKKYKHLNIKIVDELNEIRYISKQGLYEIDQDEYKYVSLLTFDSFRISITSAKYLLDNIIVSSKDTYTTSNEYINGKFIFSLHDGELILIRSK